MIDKYGIHFLLFLDAKKIAPLCQRLNNKQLASLLAFAEQTKLLPSVHNKVNLLEKAKASIPAVRLERLESTNHNLSNQELFTAIEAILCDYGISLANSPCLDAENLVLTTDQWPAGKSLDILNMSINEIEAFFQPSPHQQTFVFFLDYVYRHSQGCLNAFLKRILQSEAENFLTQLEIFEDQTLNETTNKIHFLTQGLISIVNYEPIVIKERADNSVTKSGSPLLCLSKPLDKIESDLSYISQIARASGLLAWEELGINALPQPAQSLMHLAIDGERHPARFKFESTLYIDELRYKFSLLKKYLGRAFYHTEVV
jgi:hypothetical protein